MKIFFFYSENTFPNLSVTMYMKLANCQTMEYSLLIY